LGLKKKKGGDRVWTRVGAPQTKKGKKKKKLGKEKKKKPGKLL